MFFVLQMGHEELLHNINNLEFKPKGAGEEGKEVGVGEGRGGGGRN